MERKLKPLVIGLAVILMAACCDRVKSGEEGNHDDQVKQEEVKQVSVVEQLRAIVNTDPVEEAKKSIATGDLRYWGYQDKAKGKVVPGIEGDVSGLDIKVAPGMGDVLYRGDHRELRIKFREYAKRYNEEIKKAE